MTENSFVLKVFRVSISCDHVLVLISIGAASVWLGQARIFHEDGFAKVVCNDRLDP